MRRILVTALLAGCLAGLCAFVVQSVRIAPLILAAEVYEEEAAAQAAATHQHAAMQQEAAGGHEHEHGAAEWEPANGFERQAYTVLADVIVGIGYALLLVAAFALRGGAVDARSGLLWGLGGFAVFALAPAFGLPPEPPGSVAAALGLRQGWWLATVIATGGGLAVLVFSRALLPKLLGIVLIVLPHIVGAPHAEGGAGAVPPELAAEFAAASLGAAAIFWAVLGAASGWLYQRMGRAAVPQIA